MLRPKSRQEELKAVEVLAEELAATAQRPGTEVMAVESPATAGVEEPAIVERAPEERMGSHDEPMAAEPVRVEAQLVEETATGDGVETQIQELLEEPAEGNDESVLTEPNVVEEAETEVVVETQAAEPAETSGEETVRIEAAEVQAESGGKRCAHAELGEETVRIETANAENPVQEEIVEAQAAGQPEPQPEIPEGSGTLLAAEAAAEMREAKEAEVKAESEVQPEAVAAPAQLELIPKPPVDEKAAAKLAEQQRRRKQAEEESPFSVMVGQVYDGPLDLLLDLIRKQDIDVYDIPIAKITAQFLAYVNQLKASDVDVAGEFIYTASLLIHIKSKMLLPRTAEAPGEAAEDPRRELVERLLEHERFKNAAQMLQQKQMMEAASWSNPGQRDFVNDEGAEPEIAADTVDLVRVFREILERARNRPVLDVAEDTVTVGQMIRFLGRRLMMEDKPIALRKLLSHTRSERALIAMFLALLELVRLQAVLLRHDKQFSEIFIKKHAAFETVMDEGLANARDDWR